MAGTNRMLYVLILSGYINFIEGITLNIFGSSSINNNFLGIGGIYMGFSFMPKAIQNGMNSTFYDIEFSRVCNSGLKVVRTWYGPNWVMVPTSNNESAANVWTNQFDFNSNLMNNFYKWLGILKSCNIDVAIAGSWWFTQNLCSSANPKTNHIGTCIPNDTTIDIYTEFISSSLNEIINIRQFTNVKYLLYFTEPLNYHSGILPTNYTQIEYYAYVLNKLITKLNNDNTRQLIQIVGPNSRFIDVGRIHDYAYENKYIFRNNFDIYSGHAYGYTDYFEWYHQISMLSNNYNKIYWMDEFGQGNLVYENTSDYGTYIAFVNTAAINANISTTFLWTWENQEYVWPLGWLETTGQQQWLPQNITVKPSYYSYTLLTKYLNKGGIVLDVGNSTGIVDGVTYAAIQNNLNPMIITILITNQNVYKVDINIIINGLQNGFGVYKYSSKDIKELIFYKHLYDPNNVPINNEIIGISEMFECDVTESGNFNISDSLPSRGFAVYTTINELH